MGHNMSNIESNTDEGEGTNILWTFPIGSTFRESLAANLDPYYILSVFTARKVFDQKSFANERLSTVIVQNYFIAKYFFFS